MEPMTGLQRCLTCELRFRAFQEVIKKNTGSHYAPGLVHTSNTWKDTSNAFLALIWEIYGIAPIALFCRGCGGTALRTRGPTTAHRPTCFKPPDSGFRKRPAGAIVVPQPTAGANHSRGSGLSR